MYPEIQRRVITGAIVGAVLGGVVKFALTRDSRGILKAVVVGAAVGGVISGVAAYYDLMMREANFNPVRALDETVRSAESDRDKYTRAATASRQSLEEAQTQLKRGTLTQDSIQGQQSFRDTLALKGEAAIEIIHETGQLLAKEISRAIRKDTVPLLREMLKQLTEAVGAIKSLCNEIRDHKFELERLASKGTIPRYPQ